jgi:hypothetical protein
MRPFATPLDAAREWAGVIRKPAKAKEAAQFCAAKAKTSLPRDVKWDILAGRRFNNWFGGTSNNHSRVRHKV